MKKKMMRLPVIVTCNEDGYYFAEVPIIRGSTQGRTKEEALANIQQVVRVSLMQVTEECDATPAEYTMEQVDVAL